MNNWIVYQAFVSNMLPRMLFHFALFASRILCEKKVGWLLLFLTWYYINASVCYTVAFLYCFGSRMRYHVKYMDHGVFHRYSLVLVGGSYTFLLLIMLCVVKEMRSIVNA